ncbi:hypothetical protein [Nonomuraea dietziae]
MATPTPAQARELAARADQLAAAIEVLRGDLRAGEERAAPDRLPPR